MRRRDFITLLGGVAVAWPLAAGAQQTDRVRRIGVLMGAAATEAEYQSYLTAFKQGLRQLGWVEGQNLRIDVRWNDSVLLGSASGGQSSEGCRVGGWGPRKGPRLAARSVPAKNL
jgi:hypothetical protein